MSNDISLSQEEVKKGRKKIDVFEGRDPEVKVRTKKMMMYLIIFAVVMIFAGFLSAYVIGYNSSKYWMSFPVPTMLWVSNVLLLLSSVAAIVAHRTAKSGNRQQLVMWLIITFVVGSGFMATQYAAFSDMADQGLVLARSKMMNVTGEYGTDYVIETNGEALLKNNGEFFMPDDKLYSTPINHELSAIVNQSAVWVQLLILIHALHLVFALGYTLINAIRAGRGFFDDQSNVISLYAQGLYWHFMGILWLALFLFLFFFH